MSTQMVEIIGTALLHFLWQGAALAVLLLVAISFTRNARLRYLLGVGSLVLMALCPIATVAFLQRPVASPVSAIDYSAVAPAVSNITVALSTAPPVASFDVLTCFVWIWCGGVCLFAARAFGGWLEGHGLHVARAAKVAPHGARSYPSGITEPLPPLETTHRHQDHGALRPFR